MVLTVGDLNLRDEFAILPYSSVLSDVAQAMLPVKNVAVLLRGKKEKHGIVGIIKKQDLLSASLMHTQAPNHFVQLLSAQPQNRL